MINRHVNLVEVELDYLLTLVVVDDYPPNHAHDCHAKPNHIDENPNANAPSISLFSIGFYVVVVVAVVILVLFFVFSGVKD